MSNASTENIQAGVDLNAVATSGFYLLPTKAEPSVTHVEVSIADAVCSTVRSVKPLVDLDSEK